MLKLNRKRFFLDSTTHLSKSLWKIISRIRIEFNSDNSPESNEKLVSTCHDSRTKKLLPNLGLTLVFLELPDDSTTIYFLVPSS